MHKFEIIDIQQLDPHTGGASLKDIPEWNPMGSDGYPMGSNEYCIGIFDKIDSDYYIVKIMPGFEMFFQIHNFIILQQASKHLKELYDVL